MVACGTSARTKATGVRVIIKELGAISGKRIRQMYGASRSSAVTL